MKTGLAPDNDRHEFCLITTRANVKTLSIVVSKFYLRDYEFNRQGNGF